MKTIVKITTVVAFMFATVAGMAREPKLDVVTLGNSKSVLMTLDAPGQSVKIQLLDSDSNSIYFEKLSNGHFSKKLNMKDLKDGNYYLIAESGLKSNTYTISLEKGEIKIIDSVVDAKPFFRKTRNKVFMNFLNLDKSEISLKVYDQNYRLVFSETVSDKLIVEKAFNFEGAYSGSYMVVVSDDTKTYSEEFVVN
ncbi:hypothetical protein PP182_15295 [Maribacter sp. PR1]|uniref:Secretion system C-terminal sorting domain-containing protein n=1 Tax=Maribacter cobaltidurans TaxID=1178778 RepID=A0ABU7IWW2_9FLAO|nr:MULTISPECIES: hypothetical protein [Maribacter]MDC6390061.1 hypothetical protein [Maribacter sp. PR1]MEE1977451.1 hypothetical protein [Maribacter cobaltidurans]